MNTRTVVLMGRPGSGKGTQAKLLSEATGFRIFSTGEEFRKLRGEATVLGAKLKEEYDTAKLLPLWFAEYLFEDALFALKESDGIIFEGTGRRREEAELFDEVVRWLGREYTVVNLHLEEEEAKQRLFSRATKEDRPDSNSSEKINIRFEEYNAHTAEALGFFRTKGVVIDVAAAGTIEAIHADILAKLQIS